MEDLETILIIKEKIKESVDKYYRSYDEERIANIVKQIDVSYYSSIDYYDEDSSLIYFVWLYYRWLKAQCKNLYLEKTSDPITLKVMANYNWLKDTFKFINSDTDRALNEQEIIILAKFIFLFKYFQSAEGCIAICKTLASPDLLEITNGRGLKKEYAIGSFFTSEQFKQVLILDIIQDNKLILIKSSRHTTALFKEKEDYYYLNNSGNETQTESIDELAVLIFQDHTNPPVGLEIFSLEEQHKEYPFAKDILKKINLALFAKEDHPKVSGIEIAAKIGSLDSLEYFLEENCYTDVQIFTALTLASRYGHYKIVKALLENNGSIDVNKKDSAGGTPLVLASMRGHSEIIKLLLARDDIDVNATDGLFGLPPLTWAADYNNIDAAKLLLRDQRINVNDFGAQQFGEFSIKFTERIQTPLLAASQLGFLEIVKLLLAHKDIDHNLQNDEGYTPLMKAAENGHIEIVKVLLECKNIDPNIKDKENKTAFLKSLKNRHFKIANLLLSHPKIDPSVRVKYHWVNFIPSSILNTETVSSLCNEENLCFYKKTQKSDVKKSAEAIESLIKNRLPTTSTNQKIMQYLEFNNKSFINFFAENYFNSVSFLWLYAKWLQLQSEFFEKDYNWIESTIKLINDWEPNKTLTEADTAKIENFISLIQDIQCIKKELLSIWQKNNQDPKSQNFAVEYYLLFTLEQVRKILEKENIIQNNKIVFLGFNNHAAAIVKNNEDYHLFNLDNQILETKVPLIEELVQLIFTGFKDCSSNAEPIYFSTFSFDAGVLEYLGVLIAAKTGSLESGQYFLNRGITAADYGAMMLEKATYHGHADVIKLLLAHPNNVDPNAQNNQGTTALIQAVQQGYIGIVKELLAHIDIDPNIRDKYGKTALTLACLPKYYNIFIELLNDPNTDFTDIKFTDLKKQYDAKKNNSIPSLINENRLNIIKALLGYPKTDPNIYYDALLSATIFNDIEIIEELLKGKHYFDSCNIPCNSLLIAAAKMGYYEIVKFLLTQLNINPNAIDSHGCTALMEASKNGHLEVVKLLLTNPNVDPNIQMKTEYNWTAIIYAAKYKHPEIVGALLMHPKIDSKLRDANGKTVFELINYFLNVPDKSSLDNMVLEADVSKKIYEEPKRYLKLDNNQGLNNKDLINPVLLVVIENKEFRKEYSVGSLFTLEQLIQLLETLEIMQNDKLVAITSYKKTSILFQNGTKYYLVDAKDKDIALTVISIEDLAKLIFCTNSYGFTKPSPLGIEIFALDCKHNAEYTSPKEILDKINPFLVTERGYANGCSGLQIAATVNSLKSVQYFLDKGISPSVEDNGGITPLIIASTYGYIDIVKELVSHKNNGVSCFDEKREMALAAACENNHLEIVQELLAPRPYTLLTACDKKTFFTALKKHYFKITKLLLEQCCVIEGIEKIKYIGNAFIDPFINDHLEVVATLCKQGSFTLYDGILSNGYERVKLERNLVQENYLNTYDKTLINDSRALLEKLKFYLKYSGKDQKFVNYFDGYYYNGISLLWVYIKWLQLKTDQKNEYKWFISTIELISNWDAARKLEEQEVIEVEKLTSLILEIENIKPYLLPIWQGEPRQGFENLKYKVEYYVSSTADQLKKILEAEDIIQDNKLIFIKSDNNILSILKHEGDYLCFNPNSATGEIKISSIEGLAKVIFETRYQNQTNSSSPSSAVFCVFSLDMTTFEYLGLMLSAKIGNLHHNHSFLNTVILRKAAYHGSIDLIKLLLTYPAIDPNIQDEYGYTPLMWAIDNAHLEVVKELLTHKNINPNIRNNNGLTALALAFMFEEQEITKVSIEDKKIDLANTDVDAYKKVKNGITVDIGKQKRHLDIIKALLIHPGIDTQTTDKNGWNSLAWIASYGNHKIVNEILKNPTDRLNLREEQGLALIGKAAGNGYLEVVKALLQQIQLDTDPYMTAALVKSAKNGHIEIVKMLLACPGIEPNAKDNGDTALICASADNHVKVVEILLGHPNVDPNKQDILNRTALIVASDHGNIEVVRLLLLHPKIDVNIQTGMYMRPRKEDGWPAIVYAAKEGRRDIVDLLLRHPNINTSIQTKQGLTVSTLIEQFLPKT